MTTLTPGLPASALPAFIAAVGDRASLRFLEFIARIAAMRIARDPNGADFLSLAL